MALRQYLRYRLSYRNIAELPAERGITVDHAAMYRSVQRFAAEFIDAAARLGVVRSRSRRVPERRRRLIIDRRLRR